MEKFYMKMGFASGGSANRTDQWGQKVTLLVDISRVIVTKYQNGTATKFSIYRKTGNGTGTLLMTSDFSPYVTNVSGVAEINYPLSAGVYYFVVHSDGATHTVGKWSGYGDFPYSNKHLIIDASVIIGVGEYTNSVDGINTITTFSQDWNQGTSGTRTLKRNYPVVDRTTPINLIPQEDFTEMDKTGIW